MPRRLPPPPVSEPLAFAAPLPSGAPERFPAFVAADPRLAALANDLFRRHFFAHPGPSAYTGDNQSDWREWNALCTEWMDTAVHRAHGRDYNADLAHFLETVEMDEEGYVYTYPPGFPERNRIAWPFPDHRHTGGRVPAWTFGAEGSQGWRVEGGREREAGPGGGPTGWALEAPAGDVALVSPALGFPALLSPFLALQVHCGDLALRGVCTWRTAGGAEGLVPFTGSPSRDGQGATTAFIPLWRSLPREAEVSALRLDLHLPAGAGITVQRIEPLPDTRHNTNNSHFVLAACRHALWSGDSGFLLRNITRIRQALWFLQRDLGGRRLGLLETPWWGHDGLTGLGHGIGSNYWDLLPFGHRDLYGTAYYLAALRAAAGVEGLLERHPEWGAPAHPHGEHARSLAAQARRVQAEATRAFWDAEAGRFVGTIDVQGRRWDYGFVFANLEALHLGLGGPAEAEQIYAWLDGERLVPGDTSQGRDIYHWRFAPRATTRRNPDWYIWVWEGWRVPWGQQVQDGGAVLYTSYHDVMNRVRYQGPDRALARLWEILSWYQEVQEAGGYRAYYASREGSLQGAGTAGGLGIDAEFVESALVPLVLLYGFLGLEATPRGLEARPRLPSGLPWLGVRNLRYGGGHYHITAEGERITVEDAHSGRRRTLGAASASGRATLVVAAPWSEA